MKFEIKENIIWIGIPRPPWRGLANNFAKKMKFHISDPRRQHLESIIPEKDLIRSKERESIKAYQDRRVTRWENFPRV
jgi:hypothetical protein